MSIIDRIKSIFIKNVDNELEEEKEEEFDILLNDIDKCALYFKNREKPFVLIKDDNFPFMLNNPDLVFIEMNKQNFDYYGETPRLYSFTRNGVLLYQRGMMSGLDDVADKASGYHVVNDGAGCTVSGEGDFSAVAYDLSGRQLWQGRSDGGLIVVPAESLDDGVMLLRLQGDAGTETIKLMN